MLDDKITISGSLYTAAQHLEIAKNKLDILWKNSGVCLTGDELEQLLKVIKAIQKTARIIKKNHLEHFEKIAKIRYEENE